MKTTTSFRTLALGGALALGLVGCKAVSKPFAAPDVRVEKAGTIDLQRSIPAPDPELVAIGEIELRVDSELLGPEDVKAMGANLRRLSGGLSNWTTRSKKPEYRIKISQMNSAEDFEASGLGAAIGAGVGAGVGIGTDSNDYRGATLGAAGGAALGALVFAENSEAYMFGIEVYRRTAAGAVQERLDSLGENGAQLATAVNGDSRSSSNTTRNTNSSSALAFDSDEYPYFASATAIVEAGAFHSAAKMESAARKKLIEEIPSLIFGGEIADW